MARQQGHGCSVIATQLPIEFTRRQIEEHFSIIGPVKKCHFVRDKDGIFKGVAYIVYTEVSDAQEAVNKLNNATLNDKIIKVKLTRQRDNEEGNSHRAPKSEANQDGSQDNKSSKKKKWADKNKRNRNGRIIIRNLSFKADEKAIEEHFSQYGKISEVSILKKKDGKMVGCAFVQFSMKKEALKAIKECNMKPLLGRPVAVDLAVPKEKFASVKIKTEDPDMETSTQIKKEDPSEDTHEDETYGDAKIKEETFSSDSESDDDSGLEKDGDSEVDDEDEDEKPSPAGKKSFSDGPSKDVAEERTLFIKNLSYEATEEDIKQVLENYGAVKYVLLCIDRLTQHPRGTAFAQFLEREAADSCLEAEKDPSTKHLFTLHGRPMHIMRAISRQELHQRKSDEKEAVPKDKRNLYLAREGFIREGTLAAAGVSKADMALRIKREQVKRRMLKNLHIFVSPTRLCINNLPKSVTDKKLSKIFKTQAPKEATLTETRVMKNLQILDENGKPVSRGYGFVSFTKHEHALAALRRVNNNPEIFTSDQRPIVEFSLENRSVLKARDKRMEKSKEKNPLWKKNNAVMTSVKEDSSINSDKQSKKYDDDQEEAAASASFMGSKSNPSKRDLPANYGPKIRHDRKSPGTAKISRKQLRKEQRDRAQGRKRKRPQNSEEMMDSGPTKKIREETESQPKKKKNKKKVTKRMKAELKDDKSFNLMVQNYKRKILSVDSASGKKWYED